MYVCARGPVLAQGGSLQLFNWCTEVYSFAGFGLSFTLLLKWSSICPLVVIGIVLEIWFKGQRAKWLRRNILFFGKNTSSRLRFSRNSLNPLSFLCANNRLEFGQSNSRLFYLHVTITCTMYFQNPNTTLTLSPNYLIVQKITLKVVTSATLNAAYSKKISKL